MPPYGLFGFFGLVAETIAEITPIPMAAGYKDFIRLIELENPGVVVKVPTMPITTENTSIATMPATVPIMSALNTLMLPPFYPSTIPVVRVTPRTLFRNSMLVSELPAIPLVMASFTLAVFPSLAFY